MIIYGKSFTLGLLETLLLDSLMGYSGTPHVQKSQAHTSMDEKDSTAFFQAESARKFHLGLCFKMNWVREGFEK